MFPRTQLSAALARAEAGYAGVYLLLGDQNGEPFAYIGEGEDIGARIRQHDVRKKWWTSARSEEHTSELQSLMRISYAVFCLTQNKKATNHKNQSINQNN